MKELNDIVKKQKFLLRDDKGLPIKFYHGTNRNFKEHCSSKHRTDLNQNYQGDAICYIRSLNVAWKYSEANRNQYINRDDFDKDLNNFFDSNDISGSVHIKNLINSIMDYGFEKGWEKAQNDYLKENKDVIDFFNLISKFEDDFCVKKNDLEDYKYTINEIIDVLDYIENSKSDDSCNNDFQNIFHARNVDIPKFVTDFFEDFGFTSCIYEPKVLVAYITAENVLETDNKNEAKNAFSKGFDLVIYNGEGCVDDKPEYLLASNDNLIPVEKLTQKVESSYNEDNDLVSTVMIVKEEFNETKQKKLKI